MSEDYILQSKPPTASGYPCWSFQFNEADRECKTCPFNVSCKTAYSRRNGIQMVQPTTPYFQTSQPYQPSPMMQQPVYQAPPYQPQPAPPPQPVRWETQPQPGPQPQGGPFYVPPGETVAERLVKNIILKVLEVLVWTIGNELARFFRGWTWPKK